MESIPFPPPGYEEDDLSDIPDFGKELSKIWGKRWINSGIDQPENWKSILQGYMANTTFADWSIGRILEALDSSRYSENTVVIFWSDNGYHLGEKNHFEKATLWDKASQIPIAIRMPDRSHAGAVSPRPISAIDFYPTLIELCGLQFPKHAPEGISIVPLLKDPYTPRKRPAITSYGPRGIFRNGRTV